VRPEFLRRYAALNKSGGFTSDVGLSPPKAAPAARYVHSGVDV
jgi:hypothetical protein